MKHPTRVSAEADQLLPALERIGQARREAIPPVTRLEVALHPWVAFGIMPLFALANAGVSLGGVSAGSPGATSIALGPPWLLGSSDWSWGSDSCLVSHLAARRAASALVLSF